MENRFQWSVRTLGFRNQLPPGAADAIDSTGAQVSADAGVEDVVAALRARGLGFMTAIIGLMAIRDVSLADAKQLVHASAAFASDREEREASWTAMHAEAMESG
jgi:hypothetical protein